MLHLDLGCHDAGAGDRVPHVPSGHGWVRKWSGCTVTLGLDDRAAAHESVDLSIDQALGSSDWLRHCPQPDSLGTGSPTRSSEDSRACLR